MKRGIMIIIKYIAVRMILIIILKCSLAIFCAYITTGMVETRIINYIVTNIIIILIFNMYEYSMFSWSIQFINIKAADAYYNLTTILSSENEASSSDTLSLCFNTRGIIFARELSTSESMLSYIRN